MANQYISLTVPATATAGASSNVSGLAGQKTITVDTDQYTGRLFVEVSDDDTNWLTVAMLENGDQEEVFYNVCARMRVRRQFVNGGPLPEVRVNAEGRTIITGTFAIPVGNGNGAALDTTLMGKSKSIKCAGAADGSIDGWAYIEGEVNNAWSVVALFRSVAGVQNILGVYETMRVRRTKSGGGGTTPVITLSAEDPEADDGGGGGGSSAETGWELLVGGADAGSAPTMDITKGHSFLTPNAARRLYILPPGTRNGQKHTVSRHRHEGTTAVLTGSSEIIAPSGNGLNYFRFNGVDASGSGGAGRLIEINGSGGFIEFEWDSALSIWNVMNSGPMGATGVVYLS